MTILSGLVARSRSLWRGIRRRADVEAEMAEEFRLHQELRAEDLIRAGVPPVEARRRARLEFGSSERFRDEGRASRGLHRVDAIRFSWLDVKLGFRMLVRYPGLTVVGGLAFAFAILVGAAAFELVSGVLHPTLPLPGGDRIVGLRLWDAAAGRAEAQALHDFVSWREELRSVRDLGAFRTVERNLVTGEGRGEPVEMAEISASAFRLTRVPPLLGRPLLETDERPGAPPVLLLGHGVWQRRFAADSTVVGRTVRLGLTEHTIVGVMPEGFAFPVAHESWVPLRASVLDHERREGPSIHVFGRLAPRASLTEAQAELTAMGNRAATDFPASHEHLRPQVMPYAQSILDVPTVMSAILVSSNLPLVLFLVLVCGNVALLMFARAATRESELAVRTALGASRARIVMQLFAEALVLGSVAALIGLSGAGLGMRWVMGVVEAEFLDGGRLPFWFDERLSPATFLYAGLLTLLGAAIAGVVPALKVTRGVGARLKQATAGGGGLRLGGVWTAVIVSQVAVTVAFPAVAYFVRRDAVQIRATDVGFPAEQYLAVRLEMDRDLLLSGARADTSPAAFRARFQRTYEEVERRLIADPAVIGVAFGDRLPRMYHPHRLIEVDDGGAALLDPRWPGYRVSSASVSPDFFRVLDAPILAGRGFHSGDLAAAGGAPESGDAREGVVIVNQSFVDRVMGGRNPIGRRIRYTAFEEWSPRRAAEAGPAPWYEIVGVVRDMGMAVGADVGQGAGSDPKVAGIYHPATAGVAYPVRLAVHVRGDPLSFAPRLRALVTEADPTLRLYDVMPLDRVNESELRFLAFWFQLLLIVSTIALLLSLAGIYAVMSFTVARRTREIGIRVALGASRRRVVAAVFRRPLIQLSLGIVAGAGLTSLFALAASGGELTARGASLLAAYVALMLVVCLAACIVPTRRALGVEPTEALRADG